ncbi:hypothetical protein H3C61_00260 [Candidatus Gracilibacteria bacterium]|nr:hypothetical protein [Candidatus Gracilibacteria bacterium]
MFEFDLKNYNTDLGENLVVSKNIEIDDNLNCFILIEGKDNKIITPILNKIVDYLIDNISIKSVYDTFGVSLESINHFIKTLKSKDNKLENLNIIIAVLDKNNLHFSKIGKTQAYLINSKKELIEISDKNDKLTIFDYISSGKIGYGESIILTSGGLNDYLTNTDWTEISGLNEVGKMTQNIVDILDDEKVETDIAIVGIRSNYKLDDAGVINQEVVSKIKNNLYKFLDNNFSKKGIALFLILKEKIEKQSKILKNILFFSGIIISTILLFSIISSILGKSLETSKSVEFKNDLIEAREYIRIANQNLANKEAFELNINKAEELLSKVKENNLFLNDIEGIYDDISIIKKQFNGIEVFDPNMSNLIFKGKFDDGIKLVESAKKLYVVGKTSIYGPIISGQDIKNNIFKEIDLDDEFLDGVSVGDDIILTTKKKRVVKFSKDQKFSYISVIGQNTWEGSPLVETYNNNIYMINSAKNQLYKHSPTTGSYTSGVPYLTNEDSKNLKEIVSIGIDGGIYILNNEGKMFKLYSAPKYRLEGLLLNSLPQNYNIGNQKVSMYVRNNLNYVYLLLGSKIFVFEPNTKISSDTKSLTYRGQIEGKSENILGFYVPRDGEINILTKSGIYKLNFEVKDGKILLR